jgi:Tfp pilus assembly protein PilN
MRAVNLLPKDGGQRSALRREDPAVIVGGVLGAVVMIALLAGFMNVHSKVNAEQAKLDAARAEYAQLSLEKKERPVITPPVKTAPIIPVPAVTAEEQPRLAAISSALGTRIAWDRVLREFSLVLPDDVTVSSLTMAAPSAAATTGSPGGGGEQGFSIIGSAFSHDGVARLLSRLMLVPDLENVTLGNSTVGTDAASGVQFTISASIKGAVAPPPAAVPAAVPTTPTTTGASS